MRSRCRAGIVLPRRNRGPLCISDVNVYRQSFTALLEHISSGHSRPYHTPGSSPRPAVVNTRKRNRNSFKPSQLLIRDQGKADHQSSK